MLSHHQILWSTKTGRHTENQWSVESYVNDKSARLVLVVKGTVPIKGKQVHIYDQNPHLHSDSTGRKQLNDKLTIKNIPLSVSNDEIRKLLEVDNKLTLLSPIKYACIRDNDGQLTSFKNGDRFVFIKSVDFDIPRKQMLDTFPCLIYHHGRTTPCSACGSSGHKPGDDLCKVKPTEEILVFKTYQHPLSIAFPFEFIYTRKTFRSVEAAFLWTMAVEFGKRQLADEIHKSAHAGIARRLSKTIADDEQRLEWEMKNVKVMQKLLSIKYYVCDAFRECLQENSHKVFAYVNQGTYWSTGLSAYLTERTSPSHWPGNNMLGALLAELLQRERDVAHSEYDFDGDFVDDDDEAAPPIEDVAAGDDDEDEGADNDDYGDTNDDVENVFVDEEAGDVSTFGLNTDDIRALSSTNYPVSSCSVNNQSESINTHKQSASSDTQNKSTPLSTHYQSASGST